MFITLAFSFFTFLYKNHSLISHNIGSIPNLNSLVDVVPPPISSLSEPRQSFVDKISHGLTDTLQSLSSHLGHESGENKAGKSGNDMILYLFFI